MNEQPSAPQFDGNLIVPINKHHDRKSFDCGKPELNDFLVKRSLSSLVGSTYVLVAEIDSPTIIAFFTIAPDVINIINGRTGKPLASLVKLEYLAVDKKYQRRQIGEDLLAFIMGQAAALIDKTPIMGFVVEPLDDEARRWFLKRNFGFEPAELPHRCLAVYAETLRTMISDDPEPPINTLEARPPSDR